MLALFLKLYTVTFLLLFFQVPAGFEAKMSEFFPNGTGLQGYGMSEVYYSVSTINRSSIDRGSINRTLPPQVGGLTEAGKSGGLLGRLYSRAQVKVVDTETGEVSEGSSNRLGKQ